MTDAAQFGISLRDSAHIMTILRDTLYSDKILAVLREYSANAWDSHRTSGKADVPIRVHLPTIDDATLSIQDFGRGLSKEEVFTVYTQYGASTKRDNDLAVGMLGIGSKSGFAYSDTFTITSCFAGVKSVYSATLDASDKGIVSLIAEEPCDTTGITIEIPVQTKDFEAFRTRAKNLFVHFDPRPNINITLEERPTLLGKFDSGCLFERDEDSEQSEGFIAVMGCIPYRVDLEQLKEFEEGLNSVFDSLSGQLNFKIGEVHVNASREELKYSDQTKRVLLDRLNKLVEDYVVVGTKQLRDPTTSDWQKRLAAQVMNKFKFFVPKDLQLLTDYSIFIDSDLQKKFIWDPVEDETILSMFPGSSRKEIWRIQVVKDTRIVLKDDSRMLKGYGLGTHDLLVRPRKNVTLATAQTKLDLLFAEMKITGIPIVRLSSLPYTKPPGYVGKANVKHGKKFFVYNGKTPRVDYRSRRRRVLYSESWDTVTRVPQDTDVYVDITNFRSHLNGFESAYHDDKARCARFGIPFPEVYGYKVRLDGTGSSKLKKGVEYRVWRQTMVAAMLENPRFLAILARQSWASAVDHIEVISLLPYEKELGRDHPVPKIFSDRLMELAAVKPTHFDTEDFDTARMILGSIDMKYRPGHIRRNEVLKQYPLLAVAGWSSLRQDPRSWIEYFKLIDANVVRTQADKTPEDGEYDDEE